MFTCIHLDNEIVQVSQVCMRKQKAGWLVGDLTKYLSAQNLEILLHIIYGLQGTVL